MTTETKYLPPVPRNMLQVVRRIRACESEVPAQLVFEDALRTYVIEAIASDRAIRASATSAPGHGDPMAWLISFESSTGPRKVVYTHNAIGDYRHLDPKATVTPLYAPPSTTPQPPEAT